MADSNLWNSYDRMSRLFRVARMTAIVFGGIAAVAWVWPLVVVASIATVISTTAVLFTLFAWFRADDLASGPPRR